MVPAWLLDLQPDGNDLLIYCTLARYGAFNTVQGVYEECRPSVPTMCEKTGKSESTVRRALKNLEGLKAIDGIKQFNQDGSPAPTIYRVIFGRLVGPDQDVSPATGGGSTDDTTPPANVTSDTGGGSTDDTTLVPPVTPGVVSQVTGKQEPPSTQNQKTQNNTTSPAADAAGSEPKGKKAPKEEPARPEVERLCQLLADLIAADGTKRPQVTKAWRDECRRLMDLDGASEKQVEYVVRWSQAHSFWSTNILSMPKLRQQYAALVKRIKAEHVKPVSGAPVKSFKQQDDEHKAAVADYFMQAREAWMAAHPGQSASSGAAMAEILTAAKAMENAAKASATNDVASCQAMPYSGVIEGESYETAPLAIGGGQS